MRKDGFELLNALKKLTGNCHTPFVFLKGEYLGGGAKDFLEIHEMDKIRLLLEVPPRPIYPLNRVYKRTKEYIKKKYSIEDLSNPGAHLVPQSNKYSVPTPRHDMATFTSPSTPTYVHDLMKFFFKTKDFMGGHLGALPD